MWEWVSANNSRSICYSSIGDSKIKMKNCRTHWVVSQRHVALCLCSKARALLFRTCAVKSGEVGYGDCRHDCDDDVYARHVPHCVCALVRTRERVLEHVTQKISQNRLRIMIAMMRNNPTKKTLLKVAMSMLTTMTTHCPASGSGESLDNIPFSTVQCASIQGVGWSSWCCYLLLDRVVRPCIGLCSVPFLRFFLF